MAGILEKLYNIVKHVVLMIKGLEEELEGMKRMMEAIKVRLKDAEKGRLFDEANRLRVRVIRDIFYDIEDVIDDRELKASSGCEEFKFRYEIAERVNKIKDKIEKIRKENENIDAIFASVTDQQQSSNNETNVEEEHYIDDDDDVVGNVKEVAEKLLKKMTDENKSEEGISVNLTIVGMGGIGKSTLARKIFSIVKAQSDGFQQKMWIRLPKNYKKEDLLKEIITKAGGDYSTERERGCEVLGDVVRDKKIFLVLDNVWNADVWSELLQSPLKHCKEGSKILITTRNINVANRVSSSPDVHDVQLLTVEEGWWLLKKNVFTKNVEVNIIETLADVGMKIVEKCEGLPSAIKAIANLLKTDREKKSHWEKILAEAWSQNRSNDDGALKSSSLSYEDLSPKLKRCFVYCCSLFPEDFVFERERIAAMWLAEGFLEDNATLRSAEDAYDELMSRYVLQQKVYLDRHKVHGTLRNFGQTVDSDEHFFGNRNKLDKRVRRLSIVNEIELKACDSRSFSEKLRTLMIFNSAGLRQIPEGVFQKLRHLRVLCLRETGIVDLPDSIKYLQHLKFLDLCLCKQIKMIPESIGDLKSLQFLNVKGCIRLKSLPNGIVNLHNLISLWYWPCPCITHFPRGLGARTTLERLEFKVAEKGIELGCRLQELQELVSLRELYIFDLHSDLSLQEVMSVGLQNMKNLKGLFLHFTDDNDKNNVDKITEVLEKLHPPSNLEVLWIVDFYGRSLPGWISSLTNLMQLEIIGCGYCDQLPELGRLPHLKYLFICEAPRITKIGLDFSWRTTTKALHYCPFRKLERLSLKHFPDLQEWCWDGADDDGRPFPCLEDLVLENCPKLRRLPALPTVQLLSIKNCSSLKHVGNILNARVGWRDDGLEALPWWFGSVASAASSLEIYTRHLLLLRRLCPGESDSDFPLIKRIPKVTAYHVTGEEYESTKICVIYSGSEFLTNVKVESPSMVTAKEPGRGACYSDKNPEVDESSSQGLRGNRPDPSSSSN